MKKVVVVCLGDEASLAEVRNWSTRAEVVAVALDLWGAVPLTEMRDTALAAGAARCHALDLREEFVRDAVLPAVRSRAFAGPADVLVAASREFIERQLQAIAAMENATTVLPERLTVPSRTMSAAAIPPARLHIAFEDGIPVAVNGVAMSLPELLDSLETITGEQALAVLHREYGSRHL